MPQVLGLQGKLQVLLCFMEPPRGKGAVSEGHLLFSEERIAAMGRSAPAAHDAEGKENRAVRREGGIFRLRGQDYSPLRYKSTDINDE